MVSKLRIIRKQTAKEREGIASLLKWSDGGFEDSDEIARATQAYSDAYDDTDAAAADSEGGGSAVASGGAEQAARAIIHDYQMPTQQQQQPHNWGAPAPSFSTTLNPKFFSPKTLAGADAGTTSVIHRQREPLPMLISPRAASAIAQQQYHRAILARRQQQQQQQRGGLGASTAATTVGSSSSMSGSDYYLKVSRQKLRQIAEAPAVLAKARADDRAILKSCFKQNSARIHMIGIPRTPRSGGSGAAGARSAREAAGTQRPIPFTVPSGL